MADYKHEAHSWRKPKRYPWMVCQNCGLVALKNPLTEWAINKGCNYKEASGYSDAIKKHTRLF